MRWDIFVYEKNVFIGQTKLTMRIMMMYNINVMCEVGYLYGCYVHLAKNIPLREVIMKK